MRRHALLLALLATLSPIDLRGQSAVDVAPPEQRDRERKVVEREQKKRAERTDVEIRGAAAFKQDELRTILKEQITTIHDFGLTAARADDTAFFLELFYRKHGYAKVNVHYSIESGSRLVLDVTEGPQAQLTSINFVGNTHVPASQLFEYAVGPTRERYSRLQATLPFVAADVQEGADLVHRYYVNEGYLDAVVDPPQFRFSENGARVDVTIPVHEGRQYLFGELRFNGNTVYGAQALRGQMLDLLSQPYTDRRVDDISRRLQAYFKARGYYAVKVEATSEPDESSNGHVPVTVTHTDTASAPEAFLDELRPVEADRYEMRGEHGRGGIGVVMRVLDRQLQTTMRQFDESCLATVPAEIPAEQIKQLRERSNVSQPVFARYLNTSASTVKQWESGDKHPSGMALKLLSIVQKYGIEILA